MKLRTLLFFCLNALILNKHRRKKEAPNEFSDLLSSRMAYGFTAAIMLALEHFNFRDTSVVPELASVYEGCNFFFSRPTFVDSRADGRTSVRALWEQFTNYQDAPCAVLAPLSEDALIQTVPAVDAFEVPMINYFTEGEDLSTATSVANLVLSKQGRINAIVEYFKDRKYLSIWSDAGPFDKTLGDYEFLGGMELFTIRNANRSSMKKNVKRMKDSGIKTIYCDISTFPKLVEFARATNDAGLLDDGTLFILPPELAKSDDIELLYRDVEEGSPLDKLLSGALVFDRLDGFRVDPLSDPLLGAWRAQDDGAPARLNRLAPRSSKVRAGSDFFQSVNPTNYASFAYDAVIAIGMGACSLQAEQDRLAEELIAEETLGTTNSAARETPTEPPSPDVDIEGFLVGDAALKAKEEEEFDDPFEIFDPYVFIAPHVNQSTTSSFFGNQTSPRDDGLNRHDKDSHVPQPPEGNGSETFQPHDDEESQLLRPPRDEESQRPIPLKDGEDPFPNSDNEEPPPRLDKSNPPSRPEDDGDKSQSSPLPGDRPPPSDSDEARPPPRDGSTPPTRPDDEINDKDLSDFSISKDEINPPPRSGEEISSPLPSRNGKDPPTEPDGGGSPPPEDEKDPFTEPDDEGSPLPPPGDGKYPPTNPDDRGSTPGDRQLEDDEGENSGSPVEAGEQPFQPDDDSRRDSPPHPTSMIATEDVEETLPPSIDENQEKVAPSSPKDDGSVASHRSEQPLPDDDVRRLVDTKDSDLSNAGPTTFLESILAQEFSGASGHVSFEQKGSNSRSSRTLQVGLYNIRPVKSLGSTARTYESILVSKFTDDTKWVDVPGTTIYHRDSSAYAKPARIFASENFISSGVRAIGLILMVLAWLLGFVGSILLFVLRKDNVIQRAQPFFMQILCWGSITMSTSIFTLSWDEGAGWSNEQLDIACTMTPWFFFIGQIMTFCALFTKLWRVDKVLQFRRRVVTIGNVMKPTLILMTVAIVILSLWTVMDPWEWERELIVEVPAETYGQCESENVWWYFGPLVGLLCFAETLTLYYAWKTADVPEDFRDSGAVMYAAFAQLQSFAIGVPMLAVLGQSSADATYFGRIFLIWIFA